MVVGKILIIIGVAIFVATFIFLALIHTIKKIVGKEMEKALPMQLQRIRDNLEGDLKVEVEMKKSGEVNVVDVEKVKEEEKKEENKVEIKDAQP